MAAVEVLLYGITALIVINAIAVLIATQIAWKSGQIDEYKRQYWRVMLERAQAEAERKKDESARDN